MDERTAMSLLAFADERLSKLRGLEGNAALDDLAERYDELLAALDWFVEQSRPDDAFRLVSALPQFWTATKRLEEGSAAFDRVLALPGGDDARRGRAAHDAGLLAFWQGNDERGSALLESALELGRRANDPTVTALALAGLARIALRGNDTERARQQCREALAVTEGTDDRIGRSSALHVLGVSAQMSGDLEEARELMGERLALMRELENYAGISSEASNLAMVERQLGNLDVAEALSREAVEIDFRRGNDHGLPWSLNGLVGVAATRGEHERAATLIGAADALIDAQGAAWPPDELVHRDKAVATLRDAMGEDYERVYSAGRSLTRAEAVELALAKSVDRARA